MNNTLHYGISINTSIFYTAMMNENDLLKQVNIFQNYQSLTHLRQIKTNRCHLPAGMTNPGKMDNIKNKCKLDW